jgi:hypothetical protein
MRHDNSIYIGVFHSGPPVDYYYGTQIIIRAFSRGPSFRQATGTWILLGFPRCQKDSLSPAITQRFPFLRDWQRHMNSATSSHACRIYTRFHYEDIGSPLGYQNHVDPTRFRSYIRVLGRRHPVHGRLTTSSPRSTIRK